MFKKLGLIALSFLFVSPAFASAQDFTFTSDGNSYNVSNFITDGGVINMTDYTCISNECSISIISGSRVFCRIDYQYEFDIYTCDGQTMLPGTYRIMSQTSDYFDSITFSIQGEDSGGGVVDPENPEIPLDVVGSFKTTLDGLVSDLVIGFYNYFPLVIVVGIGVLMIFTLRGYIRHASSEVFTLNKDSKKSLSWFQKEDIVNMYSNWKKDRVSKHDVNKIIENTDGYYEKDGITYYTDIKKYKNDVDDFYSKNYDENNMDAYLEKDLEWRRTHIWKGGYKKNI